MENYKTQRGRWISISTSSDTCTHNGFPPRAPRAGVPCSVAPAAPARGEDPHLLRSGFVQRAPAEARWCKWIPGGRYYLRSLSRTSRTEVLGGLSWQRERPQGGSPRVREDPLGTLNPRNYCLEASDSSENHTPRFRREIIR